VARSTNKTSSLPDLQIPYLPDARSKRIPAHLFGNCPRRDRLRCSLPRRMSRIPYKSPDHRCNNHAHGRQRHTRQHVFGWPRGRCAACGSRLGNIVRVLALSRAPQLFFVTISTCTRWAMRRVFSSATSSPKSTQPSSHMCRRW